MAPFVTPEGGLGELVDALSSRLRTAGVRIVTGTPVAAVRAESDLDWLRYRVTLDGGDMLRVDAVILATPPSPPPTS